jgi:hypothetical protein
MAEIVSTISIILQTYSYFKHIFRTLGENEVALREVFEEIFLYENIIEIYKQKIKDDANLAETAYLGPIRKFAAGVAGFHSLLNENSQPKGMIGKAWKCCRTWCCTEQNSRRIKKCTQVPTFLKTEKNPTNHSIYGKKLQDLAEAVRLLSLSAEVLIIQKVDHLRLQQTEMQNKLCNLLEKLKPGSLHRCLAIVPKSLKFTVNCFVLFLHPAAQTLARKRRFRSWQYFWAQLSPLC